MPSAVLRPLSAGELLDLSFGLFRRLFGTLVVIQLVCMALPFLLNVYVAGTGAAASAPALLGGLISFVLSALVGLLVLLASLPFFLLFAGAAFSVTRTGVASSGLVIFSMVVGLASLSLPLIVASGVAVSTPVVVLEEVGAMEALSRAWFLTRGYRLRIAGLLFVCLILILIPYLALLALGGALSATLPIWIAVVALLGRLLLTPILYCLLTLLYYDLRVRKEGFDLEMLAASLQPA